jgi:hypothetical protein
MGKTVQVKAHTTKKGVKVKAHTRTYQIQAMHSAGMGGSYRTHYIDAPSIKDARKRFLSPAYRNTLAGAGARSIEGIKLFRGKKKTYH